MDNKDNKYDSEDFNHYYLFSSLPNVKWGLWGTILILFLSALMHELFFPGSTIGEYIRQSILLLPIFALTLIAAYFKFFHRWLHSILVTLNLFAVAIIFFIGVKSDINNPGYIFFMPWTMLVLMGTFIFYRLRFWVVILISSLIVISFTLSMIINHTLRDKPEIFLVNFSFIFAMTSLGYFIITYRSKITRKLFLNERTLLKTNEELSKEIIERNLAADAVFQSERNYYEMVEAMPDWINVVDRNFNIVVFNSAFKQKNREMGLSEKAIGQNLFEVFPFLDHKIYDELNFVFRERKELLTEECTIIDGISYYTETRKIPIIKDNEVNQVLTVIRDISERMAVEELKKKNAEQKEILLREIHHRVKNNLAIVISLLGMQVRDNKNPEFKRLSEDIELRIRSMALIHEHLYKSEELDRIPLDKYIDSLASIINETYIGQNIKLKSRFDPAVVKIETAMPLGLIVNEIITNAFKYAFPDQCPGTIWIELKEREPETGKFSLMIKDNGIGLPDKFKTDNQNSLGMHIIRLLVQQIDAELTIKNHRGTSFNIIFNTIPNKHNE